ncbi:hypothetical protein CONLIGDRAFT_653509 [Coniochaeta ligniaria NRRL 30616]|uniref:GRIP domain-containing protein n=1 Tax=Coniochaeta ligniaria NRRL 30616 TaxID=1408157 RepID=A0A1J7JN42_9PEZI|nr:hypothetical protein CONLIGDRAFT_653509 [Coniochaeta ligniaria NRRL 30616]
MFQRIRGAIDRTIAEEQARQKAHTTPNNGAAPDAVRRSGSTSDSARRQRTKKPSQDTSKDAAAESAPTPDPAVFQAAFEAAFVLDDSEDGDAPTVPVKNGGGGSEVTQSTTAPEKEENVAENTPADASGVDNVDQAASDAKQANGNATPPPKQTTEQADDQNTATVVELPLEVRKRLRRLDKLDKNYEVLMRSYRVAHGRALSVEPFERTLRENTPLTSISDPQAFVEYLQQLNLKSDMVMDELKRVSAEKDKYKKNSEEADTELAALKEEIAALKAEKEQPSVADDKTSDSKPPVSPSEKAPAGEQDTGSKDAAGGDLFSYENEVPQLQAEVAAKSEEIEKLKSEKTKLEDELSLAKKHSADLVDNLEDMTRDLSELRENTARIESLKTGLEAKDAQYSALIDKVESVQTQLTESEMQYATAMSLYETAVREQKAKKIQMDALESQNKALQTKLKIVGESKSVLDKRIGDLTAEIDSLKKDKAQSEAKVKDLEKKLESAPSESTPAASNATLEPPVAQTGGGKKKNNKKKKKGGAGAAGAAATAVTPTESNFGEADPSQELQAEIDRLKGEIQRLEKKRKTEEELREEIDNLRENLVEVGQEHAILADKEQLRERISTLEKELDASKSAAKDSTKTEFDDLKAKSSTLHRYKDLSDLRESLRQESATLKTTKDELAAKTTEKDLKAELTRAQRLAGDRETEIKSLREKLTSETNARLRLEDEKRTAGRDLRRAEAEKIELSAKEEKTARELQRVQDELTALRPRVKELEDEATRLKKEAELKTTHMRDQTAELSGHKMLSERTPDVDERAEGKVREMRARLDAADQSSTDARRRAREVEELKNKVRELEREDEYEQKEQLEAVEERAAAEVAEMRSTEQRADLKKMLDELRAAQAKLSASSSSRSGTPTNGAAAGAPDTVYLKTILLQFLEQKDNKLRAQLVPVLGKLLRFDREDEKKWVAALQHIQIR